MLSKLRLHALVDLPFVSICCIGCRSSEIQCIRKFNVVYVVAKGRCRSIVVTIEDSQASSLLQHKASESNTYTPQDMLISQRRLKHRSVVGGYLLQTARSVVAETPVLNLGSKASGERMDGKLRQVVSLLLLLYSYDKVEKYTLLKHDIGCVQEENASRGASGP